MAAFIGETVWRRGMRDRFALAGLVTLLALPLFIYGMASWSAHTNGATLAPQPLVVLRAYFNGRGEQVFVPDSSLHGLAAILPVVTHNAGDALALFFDRDTRPALLDYWNPHGRLQPGLLVPFVLLGLGWTILRARRSPPARLHLFLVAGFTLPILLTSNVRIGRLIFVVPLLALLAARGVLSVAEGIGWCAARIVAPVQGRWPRVRVLAQGYVWRVVFAAIIVAAVAVGTWRDYTAEVPLQEMVRGETLLRTRAPELAATGRAAVILTNLAPQGLAPDDPAMEVYALVGYRLDLDHAYRFVDLDRETLPVSADTRALALLGGDPAAVLDRDGLCNAVYFAPDDLLPTLRARTATLGCPHIPEVVLLAR